jgi:signal peptidase I
MKTRVGLFFLAFLLFACDSKTVMMSSSSMEPTIQKGQKVRIDLKAFSTERPNRWDIVYYERGDGALWIHRVVGMPGETLRIDVNEIYINGTKLNRPHALSNVAFLPVELLHDSKARPPYKVYETPPDSYFLLGDNNG